MMLKLKLEYKCYPVWIYENGKFIDNDLPYDTKEYAIVDEMLCDLQKLYDSLFVDDGSRFQFMGISIEQKKSIDNLVCKIVEMLSSQFEVENNISLK